MEHFVMSKQLGTIAHTLAYNPACRQDLVAALNCKHFQLAVRLEQRASLLLVIAGTRGHRRSLGCYIAASINCLGSSAYSCALLMYALS